MHGRRSQTRGQQRGAGVQGERVPAPFGARDARDLGHELPRDALGSEIRGALVRVIAIRLTPRFEQVGRLRQAKALAVVALHPRELLEPLDDVVGVAEAHLGRPPELFQAPRPPGLDQQHAHDARGARREERAQGPRRGPDVPLAFLLDQDVLEREVAVTRQIDESEVVALEDACALGADVDRACHRVGAGELPPDVVQSRNGRPDLTRLSERSHFNDQRVLLASQLESR